MTHVGSITWTVTVEGAMALAASVPSNDGRIAALSRTLAAAYRGEASGTDRGWVANVQVDSKSPIQTIEHALAQGRTWVVGAAESVGLKGSEIVRLEAIEGDTFHAQLEVRELLGAAELSRFLGVTRQRISQLKKSGALPRPDAQVAATPLWLRQTMNEFLVGWRRTPGPVPAPMDVDLEGIVAIGNSTR